MVCAVMDNGDPIGIQEALGMLKESGHDTLLRKLYRRWGGFLESNYDVEIQKTKELFCVAFRYDMDSMGEEELRVFEERTKGLGIHVTCFFLDWQMRRLGENIKRLDDKVYEIGLHSEARPILTVASGQFTKLIERRYSRKLKKQVQCARREGFHVIGHAPHAIHNYLGYNNTMDWDIIENASIVEGIRYVSSWRIPARTVDGEDFPAPDPPSFRIRGETRVQVIPTCWSDKFLMPSEIRAQNGLDEAFDSVKRKIKVCQRMACPFVINLHPVHWINGSMPTLKLTEMIISYCRKEDIGIYDLREIAEGLDV